MVDKLGLENLRKKAERERLEALMQQQITALKLPPAAREYRFFDGRKWQFDFAWTDIKFAVEVEGGGWSGGRHTRGQGFHDDLVKYGEAQALGWTIYRCDGDLIKSGRAIQIIEQLIKQRS